MITARQYYKGYMSNVFVRIHLRVKNACLLLVSWKYFELLTFCIILTSCIILACDDPRGHFMRKFPVAKIIDNSTSLFFILELFIRIYAFGFTTPTHGFIRDWYNFVDLLVVLVSILQYILVSASINLGYLRILRVFRVMRPLRLLGRFEGLRSVVNAIALSLASAVNIFLLSGFIFLIYAIIGRELFGNLLYSCHGDENDHYKLDQSSCSGNYTTSDGDEAFREWSNEQLYSFDTTPKALMTLFIVSTLESWSHIMNSCMDVNELNKHPIFDNHIVNLLFYVTKFRDILLTL